MIDRDAVRNVYGTDVYGTEGDKIGSAGQVYLDNETGEPAWVAVRTGLFGKRESFVPLRDATLTGDRLEVPFGKDQVKNAPRIEGDGELTPTDEEELYAFYQPDADADQRDGRTVSADDEAMTRSEERLVPRKRTEQVGRARLRKYVVTEERQVTVPVSREEVRIEQEPAEGAGQPAGNPTARHEAVRDDESTMTLWAERPVVTTEAVPVERVRLGKETVTEQETVSGEVRKERIELEEDSSSRHDHH